MAYPPGFVPDAGAAAVPLGFVPDFAATNQKDATGAAVVDPNTLGVLAKHLWDGVNPVQLGQMLPWPKAAGGSGVDNPLSPAKMADEMHAVKKLASAAMAKGDYVTAIAKYVESVVPVLGPWMSKQGDQLQAGEYAAAAGDALALAANVGMPKMVGAAGRLRSGAPNPTVAFAGAHDIPLDAATVSDNLAVKGVQAISDRTLGGSVVATRARSAQEAAMARTGETLAGQAHPVPVTAEQAGLGLREALTKKVGTHTQDATVAYDRLRALEQEPGSRMIMPGKPVPMDTLSDSMRGQVRRIVHELDAAPYTPRIIQPGKYGSSMEHVEGTGGAGASVFDDIVQRAGSHATRGTVQSQLETYLGGGPETPIVKAALEVAGERNNARGGYTVSKPEMGANVMDVPTRLEGQVRGEEMGFPVDVKAAKAALRPIHEQMMRQLPLTQQQANPGLKAISNILEGPDFAPLSQVDTDLSAIKKLARERGGLAKVATAQLEAAVMKAAHGGGPEVVKALREGRTATIAKYGADEVLQGLREEPVRTVQALTAPKDAAIQQLRSVLKQVPEQGPVLARAYLEDLLERPQKVADWRKLGAETKAALFPEAGHVAALDQFFNLTDRISKTNVNPSGSGYVAALTAQGMQLLYDPVHGVPVQLGAMALSKLLHSPAGVKLLTRGITMPVSAPIASRTALVSKLVALARLEGVSLDVPVPAAAGPSASPDTRQPSTGAVK